MFATQQALTTKYYGPIDRIAIHFAMQAEADDQEILTKNEIFFSECIELYL